MSLIYSERASYLEWIRTVLPWMEQGLLLNKTNTIQGHAYEEIVRDNLKRVDAHSLCLHHSFRIYTKTLPWINNDDETYQELIQIKKWKVQAWELLQTETWKVQARELQRHQEHQIVPWMELGLEDTMEKIVSHMHQLPSMRRNSDNQASSHSPGLLPNKPPLEGAAEGAPNNEDVAGAVEVVVVVEKDVFTGDTVANCSSIILCCNSLSLLISSTSARKNGSS